MSGVFLADSGRPRPRVALVFVACALVTVGCGGSRPDDIGRDSGAGDLAADLAADRPPPPPPPPSEPGRHTVEVLETRRIVPSEGLPAEVVVAVANNNLDVVRHDDGRVYLAWRTAADHLAGPEATIHVVSSTDERSWRFEASYRMGTDLREPRLLSFRGTLRLHLAMLGADRLAFEPRGVARADKPPGGAFGPLTDLGWPPYIVWRTRVERGTPYMIRYLGGEHIYRFDGLPLSIELLTTTDGATWTPVDPARPEVHRGGGSEADFTVGDDGTLFAVIRSEAGAQAGWGSQVCRAPPGSPAAWVCRHDARKFDSPLMFWHDGEVYLVARRNLTESGSFDLKPGEMSDPSQILTNHLDYLQQPKRCAIWRYVAESDRIGFVTDLPSRGDTCFPAFLPGATDDTVVIYNYSSELDGPDLAWWEGQRAPTFIYRHVVHFRRK